ncbi:MAG: hypothetical protein Terrestrivirus4_164 [Terrestrivirus sp.]|uniref:Uncharacterized protein n=1 Tax=Terrestrivirus sp. TaxID=2487775 RepID=A0A3G4ZMP4_9VIRU|nr:MAG: hypothetical protein Terrestrivirus4_164 [Terrestrivirus sp.]
MNLFYPLSKINNINRLYDDIVNNNQLIIIINIFSIFRIK